MTRKQGAGKPAAQRTNAEHETLALSDRDRDVLFDALINPPEVSERLVRALNEHKRRVASEPDGDPV